MSAIRRVLSVAVPVLAGMLLLHVGERVAEAVSDSVAHRADRAVVRVSEAGDSSGLGRSAGVSGPAWSGRGLWKVEQ